MQGRMIMLQQLINTPSRTIPKATVSTFNVPSDSGTVFLDASEPAIAIGTNYWQISSNQHYSTAGNIPERSVITKSFKAGTIICC